MSPSQQLVLRWFEFSLAAAILLVVARLILSRLKQPADRVNLILLSFAMAALIPVLGVLVPLPQVELGVVEEVRMNTELPVGLPEVHPLPVKSPGAGSVEVPKNLPDSLGSVVPLDSVPSVVSTEETQPPPQSFGGFRSNSFWEITAGLLILLHLLVAGYFLVEWWISSRVLRGICKRAQGPQLSLLAVWQEISQGKRRSVRLLVSGEIPGPIAFGFWQPTIVIPESIAAGNADSLRFCLKHEWTHIEKGDLRALGFAWICQFLLWIQPLFWLLRRDLRVCQDFLADHQAAGEGMDRVEYSQLLLDCTKLRLTRPIPGTIAFFDRSSHLMKRVRMILESDFTLRLKSHRWFCLGAGAGLLGLAVLFGAVRLNTAHGGAPELILESEPFQIEGANSQETLNQPSNQSKKDSIDKSTEMKIIRGSVVDQVGKPVSGAKLWLPLRMQQPFNVVQAVADESGQFEMKVPIAWLNNKVSGSKWTLWIYAPGHNIGTEKVYDVIVGEKTEKTVNISLQFEDKKTFQILGSNGNSLFGAIVQPLHYKTQVGYEFVPEELLAAISRKTGPDGFVTISGLQPKLMFTMQVKSEEFGTQTIRVDNGKKDPIRTIRLRRTGKIEGRLMSGHPEWTRGVRIVVSTANRDEWEETNGHAETITDNEGRFKIPVIASGDRVNFHFAIDPSLPVRPKLEDRVLLGEGETLRIDFPLEELCKVRGMVQVKPSGKPLAKAEIFLGYGSSRQSEVVVTDQNGRFEGKVLPGPVSAQVIVMPGNYLQLGDPWAKTYLVPQGAKEFEFPKIEVVETHVLNGKLIDEKDQPLVGMRVEGYNKDHRYGNAITVPEGRFTMTLPDGIEITFKVVSETRESVAAKVVQQNPLIIRYSTEKVEQGVDADRSKKADVTLKGKVMLGGKPASGVKLTLFRGILVKTASGPGMRSEEVTKTETDSNGVYRLSGLKAGDSYRVQVTSSTPVADPSWHYQSPYFPKLKESDQGEISLPDLKLRNLTQTLEGQVVDPDGKPVSGAQIVATMGKTFASIPRLTDNGPPPWTTTDKEGRFRLEQLPDEPLGIMAYLSPKGGTAIPFPAKTNVELNQKDIRIILDPSLVEEDK